MTKLTSALAHFGLSVMAPPAATAAQPSRTTGAAGQASFDNSVDTAADKKAYERQSKLGRLRGMLHLQKRHADEGIRHTALPLKGLNFFLFKELMDEIVHRAASDGSWKVRADSANRINQKLEGAEKHLGSLNESEKKCACRRVRDPVPRHRQGTGRRRCRSAQRGREPGQRRPEG